MYGDSVKDFVTECQKKGAKLPLELVYRVRKISRKVQYDKAYVMVYVLDSKRREIEVTEEYSTDIIQREASNENGLEGTYIEYAKHGECLQKIYLNYKVLVKDPAEKTGWVGVIGDCKIITEDGKEYEKDDKKV